MEIKRAVFDDKNVYCGIYKLIKDNDSYIWEYIDYSMFWSNINDYIALTTDDVRHHRFLFKEEHLCT